MYTIDKSTQFRPHIYTYKEDQTDEDRHNSADRYGDYTDELKVRMYVDTRFIHNAGEIQV